MGRPVKKSAESREEKRERILRGAISAFAQKGFYQARVSDIAKAAGVADGTIYLYFENKDAILIHIFEDRMEKLLEVIDRITSSDRTPAEQIRKIIEVQLGLLEEERDLAEVVTVNMRQSTDLMKQYAAPLFNTYLERLAKVVEAGQADGSFREDVSPLIAARTMWGAGDGIALTWALGDPKPDQLRKAARQLANLILDGLRKLSGES